MRGITIRFPGVLALDNVDFSLRAGEVHALMGENGAGKSTLIKALTGVYADRLRRDRRGRRAQRVPARPPTPRAPGISTVYQEVNLCPNLSVGENVMLGHEPQRRRSASTGRACIEQAAEHLEKPRRCSSTPTRCCPATRIAVQQLVAISRAMVLDARVLILDEPTSSLDRDEVEQLFAVIRDLRDTGRGHPVREPLPRPGLRDRRPHHRAAQRSAGRRVPDRGPAPSTSSSPR